LGSTQYSIYQAGISSSHYLLDKNILIGNGLTDAKLLWVTGK
jgi:hypothetical protein